MGKLEQNLHGDDVETAPSEDIARRVAGLLDRHEGPGAAQRYRMVRRIHRLPRPLVVYLGGASGIGREVCLALAAAGRRVAVADINAALEGLTFTPNENFNGTATLQITLDDQGSVGSGGAKCDLDAIETARRALAARAA